MTEVFLISDLHFNHPGILEFCKETRPFKDVTEMNQAIIERWNSRITKNDAVWVLGDFAFSDKNSDMPIERIFSSLNGNKHLVIGNHDEKNKGVLKLPWAGMKDLHTLRWSDGTDKIRFVLCHYPLETWRNAGKGYAHAHGHCHNNLKRIIPHRYDVGFDSFITNGYPVNVIELWDRVKNELYIPVDHHRSDL